MLTNNIPSLGARANCCWCGKPFRLQRLAQRFCSPTCRKIGHRHKATTGALRSVTLSADTAVGCFPHKNTNNINRLRVVIIVHHCGIDATRPRGHTSLAGAVDAQLAVKRDAADNIVVTVERMKDGAEGASLVSKLEVVDVGTDIDGDPITSCVVVPVDGGAARAAPTRKLSDRQRLALDALADCAADHGEPPPATFELPAGLRVVKVNDWRDQLYSRGVLDREAKNPREDFRRIKNSLQVRKLIGERDGVVWRAMS